MPALPSVPGVVKTQFIHTWGEDVAVYNRMYWHYSGGPVGQADLNDWATAVFTHWGAFVTARCTNQVTLTSCVATALDSNTAPESVVSGSIAGGYTTPSVPAGSAMVLSFGISVRYRGGHPRIYVGGLPASFLSDPQKWSNTELNNTETAFGTFTSAVSGETFTSISGAVLCSVSYYHGHTNVLYPSGYYRAVPTARSTPLISDVLGVRARPHVGSQRRRTLQSS